MANICMNYIKIQGEPMLIDVIAQDYIGYNKKDDQVYFNFGLMRPIPQEVLDNNTDYQWRIQNWGNKWDGSDAYVEVYDDEIYLTVETAWGPCDEWTYELIRLCPGLNIYHEYQEGGEGFIGWIEHDESQSPDEYDITDYSITNDPFAYWVTVFEKEYENFDWLYEHIGDKLNYEEISQEVHDELLKMIDDEAPLESIITKCLNEEIL